MFAGLCGPMGLTGWLVMAVIWTGLIALVVWVIAQLFPERPTSPPPQPGPAAASGATRPVESVSVSGDRSPGRNDVTSIEGQR